MRTAFVLVALSALFVSTPGCRSRNSTTVEATSTTVGQELADLEKARNDGLMTEKEYQAQRKAILERNTK